MCLKDVMTYTEKAGNREEEAYEPSDQLPCKSSRASLLRRIRASVPMDDDEDDDEDDCDREGEGAERPTSEGGPPPPSTSSSSPSPRKKSIPFRGVTPHHHHLGE